MYLNILKSKTKTRGLVWTMLGGQTYLPLDRPAHALSQALVSRLPLLLLTGAPSTGKSMTLRHTLNSALEAKSRVAHVHCAERYTEPLLYESILSQLSGLTPTPSNNYSTYAKMENPNAFLVTLNALLDSSPGLHSYFVFLDHIFLNGNYFYS